MSRIWIITAATVVTAWFTRPAPVSGRATTIDLGALVLSVSDSPTAQVFHIVDQLSKAVMARQY
jgi:hypothetical protein